MSDPVVQPWSAYVPDEAIVAIEEVLQSKWLNTGPKEKLLREQFRTMFDASYAVACANGTSMRNALCE